MITCFTGLENATMSSLASTQDQTPQKFHCHATQSVKNSYHDSPEPDDLHCVQSKLLNVQKELSKYGDITPKDIDYYLTLLHTYNEVKDVAQELIGHLARLEGTSTKQIYQDLFPEILRDIGDIN